MKIPPYIPPSISDSFDNDNYECLRVVMKDIWWANIKSPYFNCWRQSLVTPKTCDKTETQATKKHGFC